MIQESISELIHLLQFQLDEPETSSTRVQIKSLTGMSGFLDAIGLVCDHCGDVLFRSYYDESEILRCSCSGGYRSGCKNCNDKPSKLIKEISPYEYFLNHNYIRGLTV